MRLKRFTNSAAYRIAFACAGAFALANVLLGTFVYLAAHQAIKSQMEGQIAEESSALGAEFREGGQRELRYAMGEREAASTANELVYAWYAPDGTKIGGAMSASMPPLGWSDIIFIDPIEGPDAGRALTLQLQDGSRLVVAADKQNVENIDDIIVSLFGAAFFAILLFGVAAALLIGSYLQRRLAAVGDAAQAIVSGKMQERIAISPRDDEFDQLAATLNAMLDRIAELMTNVRQVSGDIAHDLRTPLAQIRQQLEHCLAQQSGAGAMRLVLEEASERIDEVLSLFAAILRISALEGLPRRNLVALDMSVLVADLCESYGPAIEDNGRRLRCRVDDGIVMKGDRELLSQALINLLDNAQFHTPEGTNIEVKLAFHEATICLAVADDGPGVPEDDRERIVQRFIRLEASRSTPGHGLGLSLVQAIVRAHGGQLKIGDNAPGLTASMLFPAS